MSCRTGNNPPYVTRQATSEYNRVSIDLPQHKCKWVTAQGQPGTGAKSAMTSAKRPITGSDLCLLGTDTAPRGSVILSIVHAVPLNLLPPPYVCTLHVLGKVLFMRLDCNLCAFQSHVHMAHIHGPHGPLLALLLCVVNTSLCFPFADRRSVIVMQPTASMKRKQKDAVQAILSRNAQIIQALHGVLPIVSFDMRRQT